MQIQVWDLGKRVGDVFCRTVEASVSFERHEEELAPSMTQSSNHSRQQSHVTEESSVLHLISLPLMRHRLPSNRKRQNLLACFGAFGVKL